MTTFIKDESGATAIEYGMIVGFMAHADWLMLGLAHMEMLHLLLSINSCNCSSIINMGTPWFRRGDRRG
jgi:hypothetical protein